MYVCSDKQSQPLHGVFTSYLFGDVNILEPKTMMLASELTPAKFLKLNKTISSCWRAEKISLCFVDRSKKKSSQKFFFQQSGRARFLCPTARFDDSRPSVPPSERCTMHHLLFNVALLVLTQHSVQPM